MRHPRDGELTYILSEDKNIKPTQRNEKVIFLPDLNEEIRQLLLSNSEKYPGKMIIKSRQQTTEQLIRLLQKGKTLDSSPWFKQCEIIDAVIRRKDYVTARNILNNLPDNIQQEVIDHLTALQFRGFVVNHKPRTEQHN